MFFNKTILSNTWQRVKSIPALYPFTFGVIFSGMKTSGSDLLVQTVIERRDKIDWYRNGAFATFGFLYLGGIQYMIYVPFFGTLFPYTKTFVKIQPWYNKLKDIRGMSQTLFQVIIDQCIHHPFMYFPAFYITKEYVMKKDPNIVRCLQEYRTNMKEDLVALWKIWVPCTIVNFTFMPYHLRIPFTAAVSLIWTCILSIMRGGDISHSTDLVGGEVTGATYHILEETIDSLFYHEPKELESNKSHIVLTASGRDQPGWVTFLATSITNAGGNITESKMVRLGHEFIIVMHIAVLPEQQKDLLKAIRHDKRLKPLNIRTVPITRRATGSYHPPTTGIKIRCQGPDRYVFN
jgi:Mpv17 / PMP22 family/ACT domain